MTRSLFSPLFSSYLGFDSFFNEIDRVLDRATNDIHGGFPPINVFKDGQDYTIELAVAGFKETDITIELDEKQRTLHICGDTGAADDSKTFERQVVKQGIAHRKFTRSFTIAENLKVEGASLEHGLLTIRLKADEEETYKPRRIPLTTKENAPEELKATVGQRLLDKWQNPST